MKEPGPSAAGAQGQALVLRSCGSNFPRAGRPQPRGRGSLGSWGADLVAAPTGWGWGVSEAAHQPALERPAAKQACVLTSTAHASGGGGRGEAGSYPRKLGTSQRCLEARTSRGWVKGT